MNIFITSGLDKDAAVKHSKIKVNVLHAILTLFRNGNVSYTA